MRSSRLERPIEAHAALEQRMSSESLVVRHPERVRTRVGESDHGDRNLTLVAGSTDVGNLQLAFGRCHDG